MDFLVVLLGQGKKDIIMQLSFSDYLNVTFPAAYGFFPQAMTLSFLIMSRRTPEITARITLCTANAVLVWPQLVGHWNSLQLSKLMDPCSPSVALYCDLFMWHGLIATYFLGCTNVLCMLGSLIVNQELLLRYSPMIYCVYSVVLGLNVIPSIVATYSGGYTSMIQAELGKNGFDFEWDRLLAITLTAMNWQITPVVGICLQKMMTRYKSEDALSRLY